MKNFLRHLVRRTPTLAFGVLLVALFSLYLSKQIRKYNEEGASLMKQLFKLESLVSAKPLWESRSIWINQEIPRFDSDRDAAKYLIQTVGNSLAQRGLNLKSHLFVEEDFTSLINREDLDRFDRATVQLAVRGDERDIVEWIHDLQRPGNFTGIESLVLTTENPLLHCDLRVTQWYLGTNRSLNAIRAPDSEAESPQPSLAKGS